MSIQRLLVLGAALVLSSTAAAAETAVPVRGDRSIEHPIWANNADSFGASAIAFIYTRDELAALPPGAVITGLELDKMNDATTGPGAGSFELYLANTQDMTASFGPLSSHKSGATQVYTAAAQYVPPAIGWWSPGAFNGSSFTYTGTGLKVIAVWNGTGLPPAMKSYNRSKLAFGGQAAGTKTAARIQATPILDSDPLNSGPSRPNVRLTFTPLATPYLVVSVGDTTIVPGATYQNPNAFARNVTTPQTVTVKNVGGAPADMSGGFMFMNQTSINNASVVAPPALLAAGAAASVTWNHTPTAFGAVGYSIGFGGFTFTQQGNAATPQDHVIALIRDDVGRSHDPGFSGTTQDVLFGVPQSFFIRLINDGTSQVDTFTLTPELCANMVVTCAAPTVPMAPSTDQDVACTSTTSAAGVGSCRFRIEMDGVTLSFLYFARTGVTPTAPPPAGVPDIALEYQASGVTVLTPIADDETAERDRRVSDDYVFAIRNTGAAPLTVRALSTICNGNCELRLAAVTLPLVIQPGQSSTVTGMFQAEDVGRWNPLLIITSDDPDAEGVYQSTFQYKEGPRIAAAFVPVAFVEYENENTLTLRVGNTGDELLQIMAINTVRCDDCESETIQPIDVPPGEARQIDVVVYVEKAAEWITVELEILSNDPTQPTLSVSLEAEASGEFAPSANNGGCLSASGDRGRLGSGLLLLGALGMIALSRRRTRTRTRARARVSA